MRLATFFMLVLSPLVVRVGFAADELVPIGEQGYLYNTGDPTKLVPVFESQQAMEETANAAVDHDQYGFYEGMLGALQEKPNTRVLVLDISVWYGSSQVRILSGTHAGQKGFTFSADVHRNGLAPSRSNEAVPPKEAVPPAHNPKKKATRPTTGEP